MIGNWILQTKDGTHSVAAELSALTGKLKISWDGLLIDVSTVWWMLGDIRTFQRNGHTFLLSVRGPSYFGGHLALLMDGIDVTNGGVFTEQRKELPLTLQFLQEQNIMETEEVVSIEDYPFDNTFGTDQLASERYVSKESTNELTLEVTNQVSGKLGLDIFSALHAEVAAQLTKKTGMTVGQKITESQTLHFTVGASKSVVYQVVWKRKVRTGEHLYLIDGGSLMVPYRMNYGLSLEVRTIQQR